MSAEYERAERLAAERVPTQGAGLISMSTEDLAWEQRRGFVAGHVSAYRLTDAEWDEKREQVARALAKSEQPSQPWERHGPAEQNWYRDDALAAMRALGFTRTSEPGGDTC